MTEYGNRYSTVVQFYCFIKKFIIIAPFNNMQVSNHMQTLAKSMFMFFCCHQSSKQTSQEQQVHFKWVNRSGLSVMIGRFRPILLVSSFSRFIGCRHSHDKWQQKMQVLVGFAKFRDFMLMKWQ